MKVVSGKKLTSSITGLLFMLSVVGCSTEAVNTTALTDNSNSVNNQQAQFLSTFNSQFDSKGQSSKIINVRLKKTLNETQINNIAKKYNAKVKKYVKQINLLTLETIATVEAGESPKVVSASSIDTSTIKTVEPALKVTLDPVKVENDDLGTDIKSATLNDPMFGDQYSMKTMQVEEAWKINPGNPKVKIAILDTGVDLNHPDLKDKLVAGRNIADPSKQPMDDNGHGTHCSGIAAAASDNGEGGIGVGGRCSIMPVKILTFGSGTDDIISEGIVWAADNGANVMSMSLGIYRSSKPIEDALKYAMDKGVSISASAGNNNQEYDIHLPSTYPGVIEVASTDDKDQKSSFSNFGKKISVAAPGSAILSTLPTYQVGSKPLNYGKLSGTSMAAPHVAGLIGLILSQKPGLKPAEVTKVLESTAKDLGEPGWDRIFGNGRVDALAALTSLKNK